MIGYSHAQYPGDSPLVFDPGTVTVWPADTKCRAGYYVVPVSPYWPAPCEAAVQRDMYTYLPPRVATVTITYRDPPAEEDEYFITREAERKHLRPWTDPDPRLRQL